MDKKRKKIALYSYTRAIFHSGNWQRPDSHGCKIKCKFEMIRFISEGSVTAGQPYRTSSLLFESFKLIFKKKKSYFLIVHNIMS